MVTLPALALGQWTENFDAGTTLPAGWAIINNGGSNTWVIGTPIGGSAAQSGTNLARISTNLTAHDDYLITKAINVQIGVSDKISFYVKSRSVSAFLENYEVLLSKTNQTAAAFTTVLQATQKAPNAWTQKSFDLSPYAGQTVYIAVHATDTNKLALYVDTFVVNSNGTLAVSENTDTKSILKIYPNPFTDVVTISDTTNVKSVSISDVSGRIVKMITQPSKEIQLRELEPGIYIIIATMKNGSQQTIKITKK